jgi:valyl-tRNA synthetase
VISGFIVDPDRKKMSKSKGNVVTPMAYLERHGADGVRYWAAQANLGSDTVFDEKVMKVGRRLVTKLFNASKFVLSQRGRQSHLGASDITREVDRAFISKLRYLVERATAHFERFEFARVIAEVEDFFWHDFTDAFLELTKTRAKREDLPFITREDDHAHGTDDAPPIDGGCDSAVATLRLGCSLLLRLFAPFLPYITEEIWSWAFASDTGIASIHRAPWPSVEELDGCALPDHGESFEIAVAALSVIHKHKTLSQLSAGTPLEELELVVNADAATAPGEIWEDVMAAARVGSARLVVSQTEAGYRVTQSTRSRDTD